jgi:Sulfotransferase family/Domain of unknown function (DUF6473)
LQDAVRVEPERDPIIVFGAPRSGTTYLEQILNAHPEVFITHETRVFAWLHHALRLTQDHRLLANDREAFVALLRSALPEVLRDFYRELAPDVRYWGDKNPHYADPFNRGSLELASELFPGSRFVHIVRDGRDVVSSLSQKRSSEGMPWATFDHALRVWKTHVRLGRMFGEGLPSRRYFELRYEDLVADDARVAAELFAFLGIELHPAVEAFCAGQQEERTRFMEPVRDLEKGVAASYWASGFTPEERVRALELIGEPLVRYGYETEKSLAGLRREADEALRSERRTAAASSGRPVVTHGYQKRDNEVIDYEVFMLPGTRWPLRGPAPSRIAVGEYFACVGAAQTFGCFTQRPFPALLEGRLDLPALNLGYGGAGPRLFIGHQAVMNYINQARFAVVQIMSARSEDNTRFDSRGLEQLIRRSDGKRIAADAAYRELLANESRDTVAVVVEETRANWVRSYSALLGMIEVPTVLLWFSVRPPDYEESYADVEALFGEFPQLVNRDMVDQIKDLSDEYVECISSRGFPQPLVSRFTGEPVSVDLASERQELNDYYPSPQMHEDAADALLEACRRYAALPR